MYGVVTVPLFLDALPFEFWTDQTRTPPQTHWSVVLPVLVSEPWLTAPPANASLQYWVLDTGNRGAAFAWRKHLLDAGLGPDLQATLGTIGITTAFGTKKLVPVRRAHLWLVSNLATFQGMPYRMELDPGIAFHDVPTLPDPRFQRPLLGLRTLRRAGLRADIDFARATVSIWTPDPGLAPP
jgi:hypothetical protein